LITFGTNIKSLIESYDIKVLDELILDKLSKKERKALENSLIEIRGDNEHVVFSANDITYKDERVLLYIPKAYYDKSPSDDPYFLHKVHFSFCTTLQEQKARGTLSNYAITRRKTGKYIYSFQDRVIENQILKVCKNCLKQVYNDYNHLINYKDFLSAKNKFGNLFDVPDINL
jgi:RNA-binding protein YlmH